MIRSARMDAARAAAGRTWPLAAALVLGLGLHLLLLGGLDLSDGAGPGGVVLQRAVLLGATGQGLAARAGSALAALPGLDAGAALRLLMSLTAGAAALGAGLCAAALAGRRAAALAALLVACWSLSAGQAWLLDPGTPAWGLSWLGLGLAWAGCRWERRGILVLAGLLLALGVATKATALPGLAALPPALLLAPDRRAGLRRSLAAFTAGALLAAPLIAFGGSALEQWWPPNPPAAGPAPRFEGWPPLFLGELHARALRQGCFPALLLFGALGVWAAPRPRRMVALGTGALALAALVAVGLGQSGRLTPRYLLAPSLGLLVLTAGLAELGGARRRWLGPGLGLAICGLAALDTQAWAQAWAAQRVRLLDARPAALGPPIPALTRRYDPVPDQVFYESSVEGALALMALPAQARDGVATLPLRDRRDVHLEVAALQAGVPYRRVEPELCCEPDEELEACAGRVGRAFMAAGAVLALPREPGTLREGGERWAEALGVALGRLAPPQLERHWALYRQPGRGGLLPCREAGGL